MRSSVCRTFTAKETFDTLSNLQTMLSNYSTGHVHTLTCNQDGLSDEVSDQLLHTRVYWYLLTPNQKFSPMDFLYLKCRCQNTFSCWFSFKKINNPAHMLTMTWERFHWLASVWECFHGHATLLRGSYFCVTLQGRALLGSDFLTKGEINSLRIRGKMVVEGCFVFLAKRSDLNSSQRKSRTTMSSVSVLLCVVKK